MVKVAPSARVLIDNIANLRKIIGTGPKGTILKADVINFSKKSIHISEDKFVNSKFSKKPQIYFESFIEIPQFMADYLSTAANVEHVVSNKVINISCKELFNVSGFNNISIKISTLKHMFIVKDHSTKNMFDYSKISSLPIEDKIKAQINVEFTNDCLKKFEFLNPNDLLSFSFLKPNMFLKEIPYTLSIDCVQFTDNQIQNFIEKLNKSLLIN